MHAGRSGEEGEEKISQYSKLACRRRGEGGATAGAAAGADFLTTRVVESVASGKGIRQIRTCPGPPPLHYPGYCVNIADLHFTLRRQLPLLKKAEWKRRGPGLQTGTFQIFHVTCDLLYRRFAALHLGSWRLYRRKTPSVENFRPAELRRLLSPPPSIRANPPARLRLTGTSEECGEGAAPCV